ncbi:unnamed protein product, partial [Chrysoparadoxa australica]
MKLLGVGNTEVNMQLHALISAEDDDAGGVDKFVSSTALAALREVSKTGLSKEQQRESQVQDFGDSAAVLREAEAGVRQPAPPREIESLSQAQHMPQSPSQPQHRPQSPSQLQHRPQSPPSSPRSRPSRGQPPSPSVLSKGPAPPRPVPPRSAPAMINYGPLMVKPEPKPALKGWETHVDEASGDRYYHNPATQETTWDTPPATPPHSSESPSPTRVAPAARGRRSTVELKSEPQQLWKAVLCPESGDEYYWNLDTDEVVWDMPDG